MELQKVLSDSLEASLISFLYLRWACIKFPTLRFSFVQLLLQGHLPLFLRGCKVDVHLENVYLLSQLWEGSYLCRVRLGPFGQSWLSTQIQPCHFMFIGGPCSSLPFRSTWKESQLVPLGLLIRRSSTEPSNLNRICLWSNREGLEETRHCF
jgi:hypothetical protein